MASEASLPHRGPRRDAVVTAGTAQLAQIKFTQIGQIIEKGFPKFIFLTTLPSNLFVFNCLREPHRKLTRLESGLYLKKRRGRGYPLRWYGPGHS